MRHFGGTKLGTGGLVRAYREAASRALAAAGARVVHQTQTLAVTCPHARLSAVMRLVHPPEISVAAEEFGEEIVITLEVHKSLVAGLCAKLDDARISYRVLSPSR